MNFGRVKILLIIVFLSLNLFLVYQWSILSTNVTTYSEPVADQVANIKRMLAAHNVKLDAALPDSPASLPMLKVGIPSSELSGQGPAPTAVQFRAGSFMLASPYHLYGLRKWLSQYVMNLDDYEAHYSDLSNLSGTVEYFEMTGNQPIYSAPLDVVFQGGEVAGIRETYLAVQGAVNPRSVLSAEGALLALNSYLDKAQLDIDNTIHDMQLGYATTIFANGTGYLVPVWRAASLRGIFYINALNGEVSVQNQ